MERRPVICGIDIGSWTFKICVYDGKNFEVLTNEANFRQTPSLIGYTPGERLIGQEALDKIKSNYLNTVRAPMRLIGLQRCEDLIEQQLKNATAKYELDQELYFFITGQNQKKCKVQPQQLLIALFGKALKIIQSHNLIAEFVYVTIPSYLSHYERKLIKKCGQISKIGKQIKIVDDWLCIVAEYTFSRTKELQMCQKRAVLFVDIGYSKMSAFVVEFFNKQARMLDCQHMRFVGSKNMDHLLAQHYDDYFKKIRKSQVSIFSISKSLIKLLDSIQKQRKILSANIEHNLNVQSLIDDEDLIYNMNRQQFQKIIIPVTTALKNALTNLKSRMPQAFKIHSIQLLGGTTRVPNVKNVISNIFGMEPSRTLNQNQGMVRGTAIYASIDSGFYTLDYNISNMNLIDISVGWNYSKNRLFFGQDESRYFHKQRIFASNSKVPSERVLTFGNEGPIQMFIYYDQNVSTKSIGYLRFNSPNKVRFTLDFNKIVMASLQYSQFEIAKFYDKKQSKWEIMRKWENQLQQKQSRIKKILQMKNSFQAKLYQLKDKAQEYKEHMTEDQNSNLQYQLVNTGEWIERQHSRVVGSEEDLMLYQSKLEVMANFLNSFTILEERKQSSAKLSTKCILLQRQIKNILTTGVNDIQKRKLNYLNMWAEDSLQKMKETHWEGYFLTENSLNYAFEQINRILK